MKGTVYLEDVESSRKVSVNEQNEDKEDNVEDAKPLASTTTTQVKRQRTLVDMFSGSQGSSAEPSAKKIKLAGSASLSSKETTTKATTSIKVAGMQKLNSIPFSLSAYQESLSDEERKFLQLECEVMGGSWYVHQDKK